MSRQRPHSKSRERQRQSCFEVQLKKRKVMSDKLTFGTFGRYTEIPVVQMTPEQRESDMSLKFTAGDLTIHRLIEAETTFLPAHDMFPGLTPDLLTENRQ